MKVAFLRVEMGERDELDAFLEQNPDINIKHVCQTFFEQTCSDINRMDKERGIVSIWYE